jgi:hypothetical protein
VIASAIVRRKNYVDMCSFFWMFTELQLFKYTAAQHCEW